MHKTIYTPGLTLDLYQVGVSRTKDIDHFFSTKRTKQSDYNRSVLVIEKYQIHLLFLEEVLKNWKMKDTCMQEVYTL